MHKVLIAARIVGWSTIALSMSSCNANSSPTPTAQNPHPMGNSASSLIASVDRAAPVEHRSQPIIASPSVPSSLLADPQLVTAENYHVRVEQVSKIPTIPKLVKHPSRKHQTHNTIFPLTSCQAFPCLILSQDPRNPQNKFNNPIYKLTAYRDKTSNYIFQLDAVTGRGFTQTRNRYQSNTEAPLPDGSYLVAARVVAGNLAEVGGTMMPIFPKPGFNPRMRRTALGIHWDPSFDRDEKEDGTSGCIGLTNKNDYHQVRDFILKYHPRSLEVQINR
jgi:hypothetical protein